MVTRTPDGNPGPAEPAAAALAERSATRPTTPNTPAATGVRPTPAGPAAPTTPKRSAAKAGNKAGAKGAPAPAGKAQAKPSARDRLLAAANDLFYRDGVQSVGIDRVIEHAGVAKASSTTPSATRKGWSAPISKAATTGSRSASTGP